MNSKKKRIGINLPSLAGGSVALSLTLAAFCLTGSASFAASDDRVNLQFSPIAILTNALQVGAEFKIGDSAWTIGPEILLRSRHSNDTFGMKFRGDYYFSGEALTRSWYLSPILELNSYKNQESNAQGATGSSKFSSSSLGLRGGFHWFWTSFNMRLGGGFGLVKPKPYSITYSDGTKESFDGSTYNEAVIEYDLGWSF